MTDKQLPTYDDAKVEEWLLTCRHSGVDRRRSILQGVLRDRKTFAEVGRELNTSRAAVYRIVKAYIVETGVSNYYDEVRYTGGRSTRSYRERHGAIA